MSTKKARELIKPTAEQLKVDLLMADDIIQFYWKKVKSDLEKPAHYNINVKGLGIFKISTQKLKIYNNCIYNGLLSLNHNDTRSEQRRIRDKKSLEFVKKAEELLLQEINHKSLVNLKRGKL